ncbi:MAG: ribbon-helix-helix domain-containing protein [Mangrovicoccus sp.]
MLIATRCIFGRKCMGHLPASYDLQKFEPQTRRLRLNGQSTSIRLERVFWEILDSLAASENRTTPNYISSLHASLLEKHGEMANFSSILRCVCLHERNRSEIISTPAE